LPVFPSPTGGEVTTVKLVQLVRFGWNPRS